MPARFDALDPPPPALEQGGVEILRASIVGGALQFALRPAFADPQGWGMAFADICRQVARIHAMERGVPEAETIERIRDLFDAELDAPSSGAPPSPLPSS